MIVKAYAKINPVLDVIRRRPDGYHEVRLILQNIRLYDRITLTEASGKDVECRTNLPYLPTDDRNLAVRAAKAVLAFCKKERGLSIMIEKHIPVAAGLAGGSTDAAAVLTGCRELFDLELSDEDLLKLGTRLGADIPFCLRGGCALAEGIGETLTPLPVIPDCGIVLIKPPFGLSTRKIYESLALTDKTRHPDVDGMIDAIRIKDRESMVRNLGNILEEPAVAMQPLISTLKELLLREGAEGALMSGSGPSVFGIFPTLEQAETVKEKLLRERPDCRIYAVRPIEPSKGD